MSATYSASFPPRLELRPSAWPRRLRLAALLISALALWHSAVPGWALPPLLAGRPPLVTAVAVTATEVTLVLGNGDLENPDLKESRITVTAPFRAWTPGPWLALRCPGRGWVWIFADQAGEAALTPLRQVLWLNRRR
ncbi:hypothetical protein MA04_02828 [Alcanivorax balearicus MACL04]|uniref:Uncharacterized protein n=1 Tax=Alloalcanivorax balearicus MACL04 TaxID=1177182 RepID=A0ABT2R161_9GAMM|nr:hypothetical protein [Alloalcanivorax balearicus]MCU5783528.1 hypothetical protein [Alloalcanivorax balearicus MACL04]